MKQALAVCLVGWMAAHPALSQMSTPETPLQDKRIALTFDDGPTEGVTDPLLDLLQTYGAQATFFPMGEALDAQPALLRRIQSEGHEIGNHGLSHRRLTWMSDAEVQHELDQVDRTIERLTGVAPVVFRPPYAAIDDDLQQIVRSKGHSVIMWSNYPELGGFLVGAEGIADRILSTAQDGDIIFLHDTSARSVVAVRIVLEQLTDQGFQFVTVSDLLQASGGAEPGAIYYSAPAEP